MFRSTARRRMAPVVLLAAVALALTGCGSSTKSKPSTASSSNPDASSPSASATPAVKKDTCHVPSGAAVAGITVTGGFGKTLKASFKTPLSAPVMQRRLLIKGHGPVPALNQQVSTVLSAYVGSTGKSLGTSSVTLKVGSTQVPAAFDAGVRCVPIGSRAVVAVPAKDMYGDAGNPQIGVSGTDTLVIVTDLVSIKTLPKPIAWTSGLPRITFDATGKPTLKLPATKPPAEYMLKVLRPGTGAVVKAGDTVSLDYQGTSWNTRTIFDQSYGRGTASFPTDQVVPGFGGALVGQKVGTRLVVTIPPKYAYGNKGSTLPGQTLVFVIEIKSTTSTP